MKCIECGKPVEIVEKEGRERYICPEDHLNPRMILNEGLEITEKDGEIIHHSVGAIIKSQNGIILLKRRKYPYKFSIPAGHLEKGEEPHKAVLREVKEETGLNLNSVEKVFEKTLEDKCRRGADRHHWHLFYAEAESSETLEKNDEAEYLEWTQKPLEKELTDITRRILSGTAETLPPKIMIE